MPYKHQSFVEMDNHETDWDKKDFLSVWGVTKTTH